ncbi:hypothetical protein L9F63_009289, partial [Diploptera punctata]
CQITMIMAGSCVMMMKARRCSEHWRGECPTQGQDTHPDPRDSTDYATATEKRYDKVWQLNQFCTETKRHSYRRLVGSRAMWPWSITGVTTRRLVGSRAMWPWSITGVTTTRRLTSGSRAMWPWSITGVTTRRLTS